MKEAPLSTTCPHCGAQAAAGEILEALSPACFMRFAIQGKDLSEPATPNHMARAHQPQTPAMGRFPFDPMNPKPIDQRSLVPEPKAPDATSWVPQLGGRR